MVDIVLSAQRLTEFGGEVPGWVGAEMPNATAVSVQTVAASFVVDAFAIQGVFGQGTPAVHPSRGLTKMYVTETSATMGLRRRSVESTEGLVTLVRQRAPSLHIPTCTLEAWENVCRWQV